MLTWWIECVEEYLSWLKEIDDICNPKWVIKEDPYDLGYWVERVKK
jgi:hypothetical protein